MSNNKNWFDKLWYIHVRILHVHKVFSNLIFFNSIGEYDTTLSGQNKI